MNIYPVIMCGGSGTRLWPASRPSRPKQFIALVGEKSLFRETAERVCAIPGFKKLIIVAGNVHGAYIAQEIAGLCDAVVLLEPQGRDSAPAIAVASEYLYRHDPDGIAAVVASDHFIPDVSAFAKAIEISAAAAKEGRIVTMGVVPTSPNTAFGYIRPEETAKGAQSVSPVMAFVEKPDRATAKKYMNEGYLWNSGNFVFSAATMRSELMTNVPEMIGCVGKALDQGVYTETGIKLGEAFRDAQKISIDYAVMEKTKHASVLPVSLSWSDLGAWDAVHQVSEKDKAQNAKLGQVINIDTKNSYLRGEDGMTVAAVGLENLAVIAQKDSVLVCPLDQAQSVKQIVEIMKEQKDPRVDIAEEDKPPSLEGMSAYFKEWLFFKALPLWSSIGTDHNGWGFHESLTQSGEPSGADRRARVQARQIYTYGVARELGWTGPWKFIMQRGLEHLTVKYQKNREFINTLTDDKGVIINDASLLYDQAFQILALGKSAPFYDEASTRALAILDQIEADLTLSQGGFIESGDQPYQSNAHMHFLEACLAWYEISGEPRWRDVAEKITDMALTYFIDGQGGFIREFFNEDWSPANGASGSIVEPGHQFEWAWLLARWSKLGGGEKALQAAYRLYSAGEKGIDQDRGVAVDTMNEKLEQVTERARLWPQTERMKAALLLSEIADKQMQGKYRLDGLNAAKSLRRYLDTPLQGLWWDKLTADNEFVFEDASGSTFYHIIEAIAQLLKTQN